MTYRILRFLTRFLLMAYYRKIYISGADRIPADKPVLLACNHPNSFMDAIVMAVMLERPLHFLTRSDMFNTPLKQWVLSKINMIPIYRLKEGAENLHKNKDTFERCYQILQQGGMVLIFSECVCVHEKRLRPLKKGTARLAFGAENYSSKSLDIHVVPVGINYTHPTLFRKEMMIGVAPPVTIKDLLQEYAENPAKAINIFNERLTDGLSLNIIEQAKGTEKLTEQLFILDRSNDPPFGNYYWLSPSHTRLYNEKTIAAQVNALKQHQPEKFTMLATHTEDYFKLLEQYKLHDRHVANEEKYFFTKILLLAIGFPLFVVSYLLNYIPAWVASYIATTRVRRVEFYSSVRMSTGFFLYIANYLFIISLVSVFNPRAGAVLSVIMPIGGYLALLYRDLFLNVRAALWYARQKQHEPMVSDCIEQSRKNLIELWQTVSSPNRVPIV
jgi:glycerol-3-phosphate O-acyltransferase / dihydroxyacetone phosphate acyltransferase